MSTGTRSLARLGLWLALAACDSARLNLLSEATSGAGAGQPDAAAADAAAADGGRLALCGNRVCACDDGADDDGDGLVDGFDPECSGAFDDDEASFATGKALDTNKPCRDCFWDANSGAGDDDCRYPAECLRGAAPSGGASCPSCNVSASCTDTCGARTPNGCDCFGCCEIARGNGATLSVEVSPSCSLAKLDDTDACPRCVQNTACRNPCGRCELCPGRRAADLPEDCAVGGVSGGPVYRCDEGQPTCTDMRDCPAQTYCQLGCCLAVLL